MRKVIFLILLLCTTALHAEVKITPSEVYAQAILIERETELVTRFFKPTLQLHHWESVKTDIRPRHVWQKAYMVQMKIVAFQQAQGMIAFTPISIEPRHDYDPRLNLAQNQRILTEIRFIRKLFSIPGEVSIAPKVEGKQPLDVYNKLCEIETRWDDLAGITIDSSPPFAQVLRLNEDINTLMRSLNILDNAIPPAERLKAKMADSLADAFLVLEQVQRLQRMAGLEIIDFSPFRRAEEVTANHVFNLICLTLAELQQVKAQLGLIHAITPPATYQEHKTSSDVVQFLGYVANKLLLIQHL